MSLPPPIPPEETPAARDARARAQQQHSYEEFADKVGLVPNVRAKDNLYQGLTVLVFTAVGAFIGWHWEKAPESFNDRLMSLMMGTGAGLVAGTLLSGGVLLVLGFIRKKK